MSVVSFFRRRCTMLGCTRRAAPRSAFCVEDELAIQRSIRDALLEARGALGVSLAGELDADAVDRLKRVIDRVDASLAELRAELEARA